MTQISYFSINNYKERTTDLYSFALAEDCKKVADCIHQSGSVVCDLLIITNPKISVPNTISNTAIYFACIELFGNAPNDIKTEGEFKTFRLE